MAEFSFLLVFNLIIILLVVRWRGLASCEGLGLALLALVVVSDGFGLLFAASSEVYRTYAINRMKLEIVPTEVHILAMICLAIGLRITSPRPAKMEHHLTRHDYKNLAFVGWVMMIAGIGMKILAMRLMGITSISSYLGQLYDYDISIRKYGFLDQGVNIAIFGTLLILVSRPADRIRQGLLLLWIAVFSFLFSTSKSGLTQIIIPFYLVTKTIDPKTLKYWSRWPVLALAGAIFIAGLGIKTQIKYGDVAKVDYTATNVTEIAKTTLFLRFSASGIYEGYSNSVNRIIESPQKRLNGNVISGTFLGVVPRFVFNDVFGIEKPEHPFHAKGELFNTDYVIDENGNDAPTLVGYAFADFGFWSLISYMTLGGMILGIIRQYSNQFRNYLMYFTGYIFFASNFGPSLSEAGFLNIFYHLSWALLFVLIGQSLILLRKKLFIANHYAMERNGPNELTIT